MFNSYLLNILPWREAILIDDCTASLFMLYEKKI